MTSTASPTWSARRPTSTLTYAQAAARKGARACRTPKRGRSAQTVTVEALETDPYPIYARLREEEPVSWVPSRSGCGSSPAGPTSSTSTRRPDVFTGETEPSTLNRTFGENLLGSEGEYHDRIRSIIYPAFRADRSATTPTR